MDTISKDLMATGYVAEGASQLSTDTTHQKSKPELVGMLENGAEKIGFAVGVTGDFIDPNKVP